MLAALFFFPLPKQRAPESGTDKSFRLPEQDSVFLPRDLEGSVGRRDGDQLFRGVGGLPPIHCAERWYRALFFLSAVDLISFFFFLPNAVGTRELRSFGFFCQTHLKGGPAQRLLMVDRFSLPFRFV